MESRNPSLIQSAPQTSHDAVPLVLLHDGGGTTYSYHCLGSLKRPVYGIHNPRFRSGRAWKGGIPEMARVYADLIRSVIPKGKILLGGWSLGGLVSLEVARILALDHSIVVVGLVMIDSVFPPSSTKESKTIVPVKPLFEGKGSPELRMLVQRCMRQSSQMVDKWKVPTFRNAASDESDDPGSSGESNLDVESDNALPAPPTILIRCRERVPVERNHESAKSSVDVWRHMRMLGWEKHGCNFITTVLEAQGHHFDLFTQKHIDSTTTQLARACTMLETS